MADIVQIKHSITAGEVPDTLLPGEIAANTADRQFYVGDGVDVVEMLIEGPEGPQGIQGEDGAPGPNQVTTATLTNITGLLKGDGSTTSAATANVDYVPAVSSPSSMTHTTGGLVINRNNTAGTATTPVVDIVQDSATSETNTVLRVQGDGTGDLVNIVDGTTEVFTILDGGKTGIGTGSPAQRVTIVDANTTANRGNVYVYTSDTQAISKGAQISLGGKYDNAGLYELAFGAFAGKKENGTNNSLAGFLQFLSADKSTGNLIERMRISSTGNVGIGITTPTARLHIAAGTATAETAPIKLTAGTMLTTPELGTLEYTDDGTTGRLYFTLNVGGVATRVQII